MNRTTPRLMTKLGNLLHRRRAKNVCAECDQRAFGDLPSTWQRIVLPGGIVAVFCSMCVKQRRPSAWTDEIGLITRTGRG